MEKMHPISLPILVFFGMAICLFTVLPCAGAPIQPLQNRIRDIIASEKYSLNGVGVLIQDINSAVPLISINADQQFNPASVNKLVIAAAALDQMGIDYRFMTEVYNDGIFDRDSGIIRGNLYIRGCGDPGFTVEKLWLFAQHLAHQGITSIEKNMILDDTYFDTMTSGPGYDDDVSSRAYNAPVSPLSASFNTVAVHVAPAGTVGTSVQVHLFPYISRSTVVCKAKTLAKGAGSGIEVNTKKENGKIIIYVNGGMAVDAEPRYIYRKIWLPWENFGYALEGLFQEAGIRLKGSISHGSIPDVVRKNHPLYAFESEPLSKYIWNIFKFSSNFAADMLFKTFAAEKTSSPGSWEKGAEQLSSWWKSKNLPGSPKISNGSGMGNINRISPTELVGLLKYTNQQIFAPEYLGSLCVAGIDGTLKNRFKGSHLKGCLRAKTGGLPSYGVSTLAGYVFKPGKTYVFAILINDKSKDQSNHYRIQERILLEAIVP